MDHQDRSPSLPLSLSDEMSAFQEAMICILSEHIASVQVQMRTVQSDVLRLMETQKQSTRQSVTAVIKAFSPMVREHVQSILDDYKIQTESLERQVHDIGTLVTEWREYPEGSDVTSAHNDHADTVAEAPVGTQSSGDALDLSRKKEYGQAGTSTPPQLMISSLEELEPAFAAKLQRYLPARHTGQDKLSLLQCAFFYYQIDKMQVRDSKDLNGTAKKIQTEGLKKGTMV
ncbi:hypothetical protein WMY93_033085 [Mugilogobius chulae]|uniref:Uncharacterized protein n=1 Tax=Mugilogobius chulae TaxID=88201 RepID=A0AAW0MPK4_9GOBI